MPGRPVQPPHARDCFVVLPDSPAGQAAAGRLRFPDGGDPDRTVPGCGRVFRYPSGRPWLVVRTPLRRVSTALAGADAVVLIGPDEVPEPELVRELCASRDNAELHGRLARKLPGTQHVISRVRGETWVRGTASGLRRVYATEGSGPCFASDRPAVLAHLTGAALDETALALRLLDFVPHPLGGRPVWRGVTETDPAHALVLGADGTSATRRWWHAPDAEHPMAEGALRMSNNADRV